MYQNLQNSSKKRESKDSLPNSAGLPKKLKKIITSPVFFYGNNSELLSLYVKYKRDDEMSRSVKILCNNGKWSTFSIDCTGEKVNEIGRAHV